MKVALVSAEAVPFSKTGGLGDVVGALFKEFIKKGSIDITLFLPFFRITKNNFYDKVADSGLVYGVPLGTSKKFGGIRSIRASIDRDDNLILNPDKFGNIFFIEHNDFFDREELYGTNFGEYLDNAERFIFFSRAVLEICKALDLNFDIIHCHDWHTALIPLYLKSIYREGKCFEKTRTILTIHNLGYQGVFPKEKLNITGFGWEMFHIDCLEFYGMVNFLKGGLFGADYITTVSPKYAKEIQTPDFGFGLDGVLKKRSDKLIGILNGIDYEIWDPSKDKFIACNYDINSFWLKIKNKEDLINITKIDCAINQPLFAFIGRMVQQKGIDILFQAIPKLIDKGARFIFIGTGEHYYENIVKDLEKNYPGKVFIHIGFDEKLAHKIYAGVDGIIMPSKYEPCGLSQLIAMRYGTIPIVRKVGGLEDTVEDGITGFLFEEFTPEAVECAVERFIDVYYNKNKLNTMIFSAMSRDFSWSKALKDYMKLYREVIQI